MRAIKPSSTRGRLLILVLALILVACRQNENGESEAQPGPSTEEPGNNLTRKATAEKPTQEATEGEQNRQEAEIEEPFGNEDTTPAAGIAPEQIDGLLTVDDRYEALKRITEDWETNWALHTVPYDEIVPAQYRDGIRSIDDPKFVSIEEAEEWLAANEPVIAVELGGEARAYPLQILTRHEIVNDELAGVPIAVTFCPLCNSALVFERTVNGMVVEFGTSGLLRHSDLIMYDRTTESLWQQFTGEAIIGDLVGTRLGFWPSSLVSFDDYSQAYPDGQVLSTDTGFPITYGANPYEGYDTIGRQPFLFGSVAQGEEGPAFDPSQSDPRLDAMERVVSIALDGGAVAYPLPLLSEVGVINDTQFGQDLAVFHTPGTSSALGAAVIAQGEDVGATGVFDPTLNGQKLTFSLEGELFVDDQTGSRWNVLGQAVEGPLAGDQLTPVVHGDHFWFSWAAFFPDTVLYSLDG